MSKRVLNILKYVFATCLAIVLIYLAFRGIDWSVFMEGLYETKWIFVVFSLGFAILALVIRNERWRLILKPINPQIKRIAMWDASNIGNLVSLGVPWISFLVRCGAISDKKTPYEKVVGTIIMEKAWDMLIVLSLMVITIIIKSDEIAQWFVENIAKRIAGRISTNIIVIGIILLVAVTAFIVVTYIFKNRHPAFKKMAEWIDGTLEGFKSLGKVKYKTPFILYTIIVWLSYAMMCYSIFKAIPSLEHLDITDALFISTVGNLSSLLPAPGGFGAYHYFVALALSHLYGTSWEIGILFATLTHETRSLMLAVLGAISLIRSQKRIKL